MVFAVVLQIELSLIRVILQCCQIDMHFLQNKLFPLNLNESLKDFLSHYRLVEQHLKVNLALSCFSSLLKKINRGNIADPCESRDLNDIETTSFSFKTVFILPQKSERLCSVTFPITKILSPSLSTIFICDLPFFYYHIEISLMQSETRVKLRAKLQP